MFQRSIVHPPAWSSSPKRVKKQSSSNASSSQRHTTFLQSAGIYQWSWPQKWLVTINNSHGQYASVQWWKLLASIFGDSSTTESLVICYIYLIFTVAAPTIVFGQWNFPEDHFKGVKCPIKARLHLQKPSLNIFQWYVQEAVLFKFCVYPWNETAFTYISPVPSVNA